MKRILITALMVICSMYSFSQGFGLGNVYGIITAPKMTKEQKDLRKSISLEAKNNKNTLDQNLELLQKRGYFKMIHVPAITNNNAKQLLVTDGRIADMQKELNSKIKALNNAKWLDSLNNDSFNFSDGYTTKQLLSDFRNRYIKLVEKYTLYYEPLSTGTNEKYILDMEGFWKSEDAQNLLLLEKGLAKRKELYENNQKDIAERKKQQELYEQKQNEYRISEEKRVLAQQEKQKVNEAKREAEIASLPTKAVIKTKFRTYTHKTGNVFEWFPAGFTPKGGKAVIDRVWGIKAMYREVDGNGINTLKIEYYDSGSIMNVTVYGGRGGDMIYYAEYRDHAKKPYEIQTYSADGKFYVVHKRTYDMYDDKTYITTKYQYQPLDYWYE